MFLRSQLDEISHRYQADVEDLQVLLEEERLLIPHPGCLQELSTRLRSDPRFRRDLAFLVRSMFGRGRDEPGSMDVLGILVVATSGTRQEFDNPSQQQAIRELLRFVIQQRRPEADTPFTPDATAGHGAAPNAISPQPESGVEGPSPARSLLPSPVPSLLEAEPRSRPVNATWTVAAIALLVVVGAGLLIRHSGNGELRATNVGPAASSSHTASAPKDRAILPEFPKSSHKSRQSPPRLPSAASRYTELPQPAKPLNVAANTPPNTAEKTEAAPNFSKLSQSVNPSTVAPALPHQGGVLVSPPVDVSRARNTPSPTDIGNVFAHPQANAAAAANQVSPPVFRAKEPVLIARNTPAAIVGRPDLQGTVRTGSAGTMASSLMYSPEPEYPARAIAAGVQGQVTVRAVVGPEGNVIEASVVSGPPLLREAALDAVGRWRYRPYEQDGKPLTIATTAILDFQLPLKK